MAATGISGNFEAKLTATTQSLTSSQFVERQDTPGNVGVCLSGGGSRALSAGMGQLRALSFLQLNGSSLLSQTRTLSTVSGGSWVGVTFEYLPAGTSDAQYLNAYVPNQGDLVPDASAGHPPAETLNVLPSGNIGNSIATDLFSVPALAVQAYLLYKFKKTPPNFVWQALIGMHILGPYNLYNPTGSGLPRSLFTWDQAALSGDVTGPNPPLAAEPAHLVAAGAGHDRRPFLICNAGMFLNHPGSTYQYLAPQQFTPFMSGIVGTPNGTDANGLPAGGGGVTSFAFNSNPTAVAGSAVAADQSRQLALADIVGTSSAAFAAELENLFASWQRDPKQLFAALQEHSGDIAKLFETWFPDFDPELEALQKVLSLGPIFADLGKLIEAKADMLALQDIIPQYQYWPVAGAAPAAATKPTRFADGGNLENLGVAATLSYTDVDRLISFINTDMPLGAGDRGVIDANGNEIPGTRVAVTQDLPPLFGYQPYVPGKGYLLYEGASNPGFKQGRHSAVFPPASFAAFLQGLWAATGGTNATAAVFKQDLEVQDNAWFGVRGGRSVTVLWVYNNRVKQWYDLLNPQVKAILGDFGDPTSYGSFPNYDTLCTNLDATQINLLANLSAWVVAADANRQAFLDMYS